MSIWELIRLASQGILVNRLRSFLTILGITFGIAAVIALLAVGTGASIESDKQIKALGTNIIYIWAGAASVGHVNMGRGSSSTLTLRYADAIRDMCPAIAEVAPGLNQTQQVQYGGQNVMTNIVATVPEYEQVRNFHVQLGRFFNQSDCDHNARVCMIGTTVQENLFDPEDNPIGKKVLIKGEFFEVIGVLEKKGSSTFTDMDDMVIVPITTAYNRLFGFNMAKGKAVHYILVQALDEEHFLPAQFQITNLMRLRHQIKPPMMDDFYLRTQQDLLQISQSMTNVFTLLLGSTAAISLLVGGIGIMNIMLVSVTERTREIGIRKAIGARPKDIMFQFVVEATVLSLAGGIFGIGLGFGGAHALSFMLPFQTVVTPWSVMLSFVVSIMVGLFFGIYPARRAALLDPITALRTE